MDRKRLTRACAAVMALFMFAGCADNTAQTSDDEIASDTTLSETASETEAETTVETVEVYDLENLNDEDFSAFVSKLGESDLFAEDITAEDIKVINGGCFEVAPEKITKPLFRNPTEKMSLSEDDNAAFEESVQAADRFNSLSDFDSARNIEQWKVIVNGSLNGDLSFEVTSYSCSCKIKDAVFNGLVRKTSDGKAEVIADPAYMYGIPVPENASLTFDIDGKVMLDSISFTGECSAELPENDDNAYSYASITADIEIIYDSNGSSLCTGTVTAAEILSPDGVNALKNGLKAFLFENKDQASAMVFDVLKANMDMFLGEDVMGVNLIDLDFDELPELLVSKRTALDVEQYDGGFDYNGFNVDIYRFKDNSLAYIDTLYNRKIQIYQTGNVIGLKKNSDGTDGWYYMSRCDVNDRENIDGDTHDYLFTLEGDKLVYSEIFTSDGEDSENPVYYMNGELIKPEITVEEGPYDDEEWEYYSYNGIKATFGMWELWGFLREKYTEDIDTIFNLNSDFLCENTGYYEFTKLSIDERSLEYKLANLTDAFFFGEYNPSAMEYRYEFLGDYAKPVIYLYPEEKTDVSVKLDVTNGGITASYPEYMGGWNVIASPDGTLTDRNGREYYCLYWEGIGNAEWDMSRGFVVKAEDTADFLETALAQIGLTPREANEFIIYWLPELMKSPCNYITFQTDVYDENVKLNVSPAPDSILRVFMVYAPCSEEMKSEPQTFQKFNRNGFTVVEWGGAHIN